MNETAPEAQGPRKSVQEKVDELKVRRRDCRSCRAFQPDESGRGFGWCKAFEQYVKLYHPAGEFWSQCQFKVIARTPECATEAPAEAPHAVAVQRRPYSSVTLQSLPSAES